MWEQFVGNIQATKSSRFIWHEADFEKKSIEKYITKLDDKVSLVRFLIARLSSDELVRNPERSDEVLNEFFVFRCKVNMSSVG